MAVAHDKYDEIFGHPILDKLIENLTFNQFFKGKFNQLRLPLNAGDIRKAVWLTSILSTSEDEIHRSKSQLIASLLYLQNIDDEEIERACYVLFSRVGNLTGTLLLKSFGKSMVAERLVGIPNRAYGDSLDLELEIERSDKLITLDNETILSTRFQKQLWENLHEHKRLIISAPTSAGKSFIVKKYLKEQLNSSDTFTALYIVPSRALLNQVSEELRNEFDLQSVDIKTVFIPNDPEGLQKQIFILTPERCLKLLKERWKNKFQLDFIFIDEIQNVEDLKGRGTLFEYVFKELGLLFISATIVAAGPNILYPENLFDDIFEMQSYAAETQVSPVIQLKTTVSPLEENKIKFTIKSQKGLSQTTTVVSEVDLKSAFAKSIGTGLRELINLCGSEDQNIIYAPKGNLAENWAQKFIETAETEESQDSFIKEIVDFLKDEIHPSYSLIKCLKKGVAFHHGSLPDIVRKEIEDCFLEGRIKNLFCTSTLLQGVNLPANNIFIAKPEKKNFQLTDFDFGNLIGRAGRIRDTLYGTIYCIEMNKDKEWSQELYDRSPRKEVVISSNRALESLEDLFSEFSKSAREMESALDVNAIIFFRQKYLQSPELFSTYLDKKNISIDDKLRMIEFVKGPLSEIQIPPTTIRLNPTIDPILQNELYKKIKSEGIEKWLIASVAENPNFYEYITREQQSDLPFEQWSFYLQINNLITRLDEIFEIANEAWKRHDVSISINQICFYARDWIRNRSFAEMIRDDIRFYSTHSNEAKRIDPDNAVDVNKRINKVIKINSIVITHLLVKYIKLINDVIEPMLNETQFEKYKFSLALPTMFELGTTEPAVITLISRGISRSIALKIFGEFKKVYGHENLDIIRWLSSKSELKLKPIYNRYLKRMKMLKVPETYLS
jgi:superfamily II DNA or RNA helicase